MSPGVHVSLLAAGALALAACSSGSGHSFDGADGAASAEGGPSTDAAGDRGSGSSSGGGSGSSSGSGGASSGGNADAGAGGDASDDADAGSPCVPLGGSCSDSTICICGPGSGCAVDNVACDAGVCALAYTFSSPATCCETCELAYDQGGSFVDWTTCNAKCGAAGCPMRCFAH